MKEDFNILRRHFCYRAHKKSLFEVEIYPGIIAEFGEPKSKLYSKKYRLTRLKFSKDRYCRDLIDDFRKRFHVKYLKNKNFGKKLPPIYKVIGRPDRLVRGGYIIVCENTSALRETYKQQNTYEFWLNEFYKKSTLSNDSKTLNEAIPLLIDRIENRKDFLNQVPTKDHRIFEELVAEIFKEFGYEVELTKKTRDGGKDIIALKKVDGKIEEKLLIECKHWDKTVGVAPIRDLIGVAATEKDLPTGVILATTSRFSRCAKKMEIHKTIMFELERKDYDDIIKWIGDYNAIQFSKSGINSYFESLKIGR